LTYLASLTYRITEVLFIVNCIKKHAEVLPHSPVATGSFAGLHQQQTHADKLGVSMGLHYSTEITP